MFYEITFSPTGGTKKCADLLSAAWREKTEIDLMKRQDDFTKYTFTAEDICLVAVPSFGGRVPAVATERLQMMQGGGAKAILVVVYGNRAYEDTLVELEEQHQLLEKKQAVLETDRWIIDGNFRRTMPQRIEHCDTILYLDYSRWLCLLGMLQRVIGSYGKVRPDMAEGCPERFDWDFVLWIWNFNRENRDRNYSLINNAKHANTIVLKNRWQTKRFLRKL